MPLKSEYLLSTIYVITDLLLIFEYTVIILYLFKPIFRS